MSQSAIDEILAESQRMQRDRPVLALLHLLLPLVVLIGTGVALWANGSLGTVSTVALTAFFTIGKLIILTGAVSDSAFGMNQWELAATVMWLDLFVAYVFAFNLHWVHRIPRVGPAVLRLQNYCRYWLSMQPWMKRSAFSAVALFVMFPLTGTGAPGGSLLGRLVGLRPGTTLSAIGLGSILGCGLMASFATPLEAFFHDIQHTLWFKAAGLASLAIVGVLLFFLGRRLSRAADLYEKQQQSGGDA